MKSASFKNTLRSIWRTKARYISILFIVALGVGFFAGIKASEPDMINSTDKYSDMQNLMHFRLISTWGFDDEEVRALEALDGVSVKRSYFYDCVTDHNEDEAESRFIAYDKDSDINQLWLKDGRFPVRDNECLLDSASYLYPVGTKISVVSEDAGDNLKNTEYTIVGHVYSAMYVSDYEHGNTTAGDGGIDHIVFVPAGNFTIGYYTELYLVFSDMKAETVYTQGYKDLEKEKKPLIEEAGAAASSDRYMRTAEDSEKQIADAEAELEKAEAELVDAKKQLEDAKAQIDDGEKQLEDAEKLLSEKRGELEDGEKQLNDAEAEYAEKYAELTEGTEKLMDARRQYSEGLEEYASSALEAEKELAAAKEQISVAEVNLDYAREELESSRESYETVRGLYDKAYGLFEELKARYEEIRHEAGLEEEKSLLKEQLEKAEEAFLKIGARLDESKAELYAGQAEFDRYVSELEEAKRQYEEGRARADRELSDAKQKLEDAKAEIEYNEGLLEEGRALLAQGREELDANGKVLSEARAEVEKAEAELAEKRADLEAGIKEYNEGKAGYEDGLAQLAEGKARLADSKKLLEELEPPEWFIYTRDDNGGYQEYGQNAERIGNIAKVFPAFFIIVAALVSITGMTRMVSEERTQIGTLKALGYSGIRIFGKYLFYGCSATFLGCVLGLAVGYKLFPFVIFKAYSILYRVQVNEMPFLFKDALIITGVSLALSALTVLFSCVKVMMPVPAQLMRPSAPPSGKRVLLERIRPVWKRLSFFSKVTVRNVFRYKKRMIMTLIGIMGCTALMLCGFALRDSISDIVAKQFDNVMHFDAMAYTQAVDREAISEIQEILGNYDKGAQITAAMQKSYSLSHGDVSHSGYVMVGESAEKTQNIMEPRNRTTGERYTLEPGEALVTEKLAKILKVREGDVITVSLSDTEKADITVGGVIENYIYHYVFITPETYTAMIGDAPEFNLLYLTYDVEAANEENLAAEIIGNDKVLTMVLQSSLRKTFSKMMEALDAVVLVLILSAVLLAVIVLYNLSSINIAERIREIATLEVLGFTDNEVSMYIFRENIVLTLLGALLGLGLGRILASFVINTAEIDMVMFGREVHFWSYLLAAGLTVLFSLAVSLIMNRPLRKISMVESLKSVD
jgi:putative ABC transport system permease protein